MSVKLLMVVRGRSDTGTEKVAFTPTSPEDSEWQ